MLRIGIALPAVLALAACGSMNVGLSPPPKADADAHAAAVPPPPTGEWKFDGRIEQATGKPVGRAFVKSEKVTLRTGRFIPDPAFMLLDCFKDEPTVLFRFTGRKVGSNTSASLTYRFNDGAPRDPRVRFLRDGKSIMIEDRTSVRQLVAELRNATTLVVSVKSMMTGMTRAEFPVQHAGVAIEKSFAACPLPDEKAPRVVARDTRR